jgi:hypothetical protein
MLGDAGQHGPEVRLRIEAVELGRANQGVDRRRSLAAGVGAREQIVLPVMPSLA